MKESAEHWQQQQQQQQRRKGEDSAVVKNIPLPYDYVKISFILITNKSENCGRFKCTRIWQFFINICLNDGSCYICI